MASRKVNSITIHWSAHHLKSSRARKKKIILGFLVQMFEILTYSRYTNINPAHFRISNAPAKIRIEHNNFYISTFALCQKRIMIKINFPWLASDVCFPPVAFSSTSLQILCFFLLRCGASKVNDKVYFACRFECVCHSVLALRDCEAIVMCNSAHVEMDPTSPPLCPSNSILLSV